MHRLLAANLRFKDFPVVDSVLAGLARVTDEDTAFEFVEINAQLNTMLATGRQFDGRGTAKSRGIVVLRACGNIDDDGFGVAADVDPVHFALPCSGETVQRGANSYGHGARTADAGAGGSFGIGHQREAALRAEKLGDFSQKRKAITLGFHEHGEGGEAFFALRVAGHEVNRLAAIGFNTAGSIEGNGRVDGDRAGMKQVERPNVERSTGEVHASWRL